MPRQPSHVIADALRAQIGSGQLAPGARLPSERALALEHGCARNTARAAIALLHAEGLVDTRHGAGVWVADTQPVAGVRLDRLDLAALQALRAAVDEEINRRDPNTPPHTE